MSNIINTCSDTSLAAVLYVIKSILNIIHIIVPILLIISLAINIINLTRDPDKKNGIKELINKAIAAVVVFFIPTIINALIIAISGDSNFSNCWINANNNYSNTPTYQSNKDRNKNYLYDDAYEKGTPKTTDNNSSQTGTGSFNLEHAINITSDPHSSEHENLPWHGSTVGKHAGMIGAYVEAINILNGTNYTLKEVYNSIISAHPDQKNKNVPVYENDDINSLYHIKYERAPANIGEIKKALQQGKIVAEIVDTDKWRDENGNFFGKTGRHTGLIFYYDGKYFHMKTSVKKNAIYTEEQLVDWLGNTSTPLIVYSKSNN